jgi:hypothetical protein
MSNELRKLTSRAFQSSALPTELPSLKREQILKLPEVCWEIPFLNRIRSPRRERFLHQPGGN